MRVIYLLKKYKYIIIVFFLLVTCIGVNLYVKSFNDMVYPNVYVEGISVGGLSKKEGIVKVCREFEEKISNKTIDVVVENDQFKTNYNELGVKYDISEAINKAFSYGKDLNVFRKLKVILLKPIKKININITYNEELLNSYIYEIESSINVKPIDGKISIDSNGTIEVEAHEEGIKLKREELKRDIVKEIEKKDLEKSEIIIGKLEVWSPRKTYENLKKINKEVSFFSTGFYNSSESRKKNIELATEAINGVVIMPGDIFSFNDTVGARTEGKGYQRAKVISGNKYVEDIGGGICQVSSTLYNAVLKSDIQVVERKNHSLKVNYIPLGRDATVSYGATDFKFKNTTEYPIYLYGESNNNSVEFKLYSNNELTKNYYEIETEIEEVIQPKNKIKYSSSLSKGDKYIQKSGKVGYKVNTYKKLYIDGEFIDKILISKDIYKQIDNIVIEGR